MSKIREWLRLKLFGITKDDVVPREMWEKLK